MSVSTRPDWGCMWCGAINCRDHEYRRTVKGWLPEARETEKRTRGIYCTRKKFAELLFENCADCKRMAAIPQGAFAACKVRDNRGRSSLITMMEEKENVGSESIFNARPPLEGRELTPLKYNSKLMNSIWGLYNRYSVHNFKKNNDASEGVFKTFMADWGAVFQNHSPAANGVTAAAVTQNNS